MTTNGTQVVDGTLDDRPDGKGEGAMDRSARGDEGVAVGETTSLEAIRRSVTVRRPPEDAFRIFTGSIGRWWPIETHSVAAMLAGERGVAVDHLVFEARLGGRLYEVMTDGTEASWGTVVLWEPPARLTLAWHVNPRRPAATEIDVRFTEESPGITRVDLEHRGWDRLGEAGPESRAEYSGPGGWTTVLFGYEELAASEA